MAAFTSKATGNWSASGQTTWNEVGVPGNGDTVSIANGHTITVDTNTTIGTSPAPGTNAISIAAVGVLSIADGITLTVRGDVSVTGNGAANNNQVILGAGSTWKFDGSQAASPSTAAYKLVLGLAAWQHPRLKINGTSVAHAMFTSDSGGANGYIANTGLSGSYDCDWCDFSRIGAAAVDCVAWSSFVAPSQVLFSDCTFDNCGMINLGGSALNTAIVSLERVKVTNTLHSTTSLTIGSTVAISTGTRLIDDCSFDKLVTINVRDFTITGNYFGATLSAGGSSPWATFTDNFVYRSTQPATTMNGDASDCFFYKGSVDNPHFVTPYQVGNIDIVDCVFEHGGTQENGDCITAVSATGAQTYTATGNIVLPNSNGGVSGTLISLLGNANCTWTVNHNTYKSTAGSAIAIAETYTGHSGMLASCQSNLAWHDTATTAMIVQDSGANDAATGYITDLGYNGAWNPVADPYDVDAADITNDLTANDVYGDPGFVDSTRDLGSWGQVNEATDGTATAAMAVLAADPTKIPGMMTWIRAGFVVTNAAFENAGHDGVTIGAMGYEAAASLLLMNARSNMRAGRCA